LSIYTLAEVAADSVPMQITAAGHRRGLL